MTEQKRTNKQTKTRVTRHTRRSLDYLEVPPALTRRRLVPHEVQRALHVHLHDRRLVPAPVAVVGRGEEGDHLLGVVPHVPLHHELVGAGDELHVVLVTELLADVLPEYVARPWSKRRGDERGC